MTPLEKLKKILEVVQVDRTGRGLARDPARNLFNAWPDDFALACRSLAEHSSPVLGVVTGFWIPSAQHGETDGPLGAVYLARTLPRLGIRVVLVGDPFCRRSLEVGLAACRCEAAIPVADVPEVPPGVTHLLALERVGPSHTLESLRAQPGTTEETVNLFLAEVPADHHDRCHTMRGLDITDAMRNAANLFEKPGPVTIGVGDGGNEIGMGKIPWPVLRANIDRGGLVGCRIATDYLVVAGVSNWGAYALASGIAALRGHAPEGSWYNLDLEKRILDVMVNEGRLVDGVTGQFTCSVDGLSFTDHAEPLRRFEEILGV